MFLTRKQSQRALNIFTDQTSIQIERHFSTNEIPYKDFIGRKMSFFQMK